MQQMKRDFNGLELALIGTDDGDFCLSADQAAQALGYADTAGFHRLMKRNAKLIAAHKGVVKLTTPGGVQDVTVISEQGLYLLAMKSGTEQAERFQLWLSQVVKDIRKGAVSNLAPADPLARMAEYVMTMDQTRGLQIAAVDAKADQAIAATKDAADRAALHDPTRLRELFVRITEIEGEMVALFKARGDVLNFGAYRRKLKAINNGQPVSRYSPTMTVPALELVVKVAEEILVDERRNDLRLFKAAK